MFNKYGLLLVTSISLSCQVAFAGGDGSEFDTLAAELAGQALTLIHPMQSALNKKDTQSSGGEINLTMLAKGRSYNKI